MDPNTGLIAGGEKFVGLQNFTNIFTGANPVTGNYGTIDPLLERLPQHHLHHHRLRDLETILGVAMALIMAKAFRGRGSFGPASWCRGPSRRSFRLMWKLIFDSSGVANRILGREILWLADTGASFWAIVIADTWKTAPFIGC